MAKETKNIEQIIVELNTIIDELESGDASLEDSFLLYSEGMKLVKNCNDKIDKVEKKIIVLGESEGSNEL